MTYLIKACQLLAEAISTWFNNNTSKLSPHPGLLESDENCVRFVNRCMPEAFRKLMTSKAVHRWGAEIHEGIYNMLQLFIELVAVRLKYKPVPIELLEVLGMVCVVFLGYLSVDWK